MLEKGLSAQSRTTVTNENTAAAMGSGDLPVFATPSMVALMENAAMTAAAAALPAGSTTVGAEMNVTHIKPSGLMIGEGVHIRYVVDREKFMAKLG